MRTDWHVRINKTLLSFTDEDDPEAQQGEPSSDPVDSLYRDVLGKQRAASPQDSGDGSGTVSEQTLNNNKDTAETGRDPSDDPTEHQQRRSDRPESSSEQQHPQDRRPRSGAPTKIIISQTIGSLLGAATSESAGRLTVTGRVEAITDEEILTNRESEEGIRSIARFRNYEPGKPCKVMITVNCEIYNTHRNLLQLPTNHPKASARLRM